MHSNINNFNIKLIQLRNYCGFSQTEVADYLNITQPSYHKMETSKDFPRIKRIVQLADLYSISTNDLLFESFEALSQKVKCKNPKGKNLKY